MTVFTSVSSLRWADAEKTMVDCKVAIEKFGSEVLPFTASSKDNEAHGRALFAAIVAGKYGPIAEYFLPQEPKMAETATPSSGEISSSAS
jgi:hypothetical protein